MKEPRKNHPSFYVKVVQKKKKKLGRAIEGREKMTKMKITLFMLAAIAGCLMMGSVSAMTHIVGGGHGWRLPDNQTFFEEWAKPRTFGVGDRLGKFNAFWPIWNFRDSTLKTN